MKKKRILSALMALLLIASLPVSAFAAEWYMEDGDITVNSGDSGQTVTQGTKMDVPDDAPVITQKDSTTATGNTITVTTTGENVAEFTIKDVNIEADGDAVSIGDSSAEITLEGDNKLYSESGSAVYVTGGNATITGSGTLEAEIGDNENAKIGSHGSEEMSGSIHITGNTTVTTKDDQVDDYWGGGAAIGSGDDGDMSGNILVDGSANVAAFSQEDGAGIGSGEDGHMSGNITIRDNAQVIAVSGYDGSGIGAGEYGDLSGSVVIEDHAQVTAWSEKQGAGIGTGEDGEVSGSIIIGGHAQVTAGSDEDGAGIGGGGDNDGHVTETGRIIIRDFANVTAIGEDEGCGIGAGEDNDMDGRIIIRDNAQVTAIAGDCAAAIGSDDADDMKGSIIIIGNANVSTGILLNDDIWFDYDAKEIKYTVNPDAVGYIGDSSASRHDSPYGNYILGSNITINGIKDSDTESLKEYVNMRLSGDKHDGDPENLTMLDYVIRNNEITVTATGDGTILQILYGGDETPPTKPGTYPVTVVMQVGQEMEELLVFEICDLVIPEPETADDPQGEPLYRVTDKNDKDISHKAEQKDGVLTITVDRDFAILTGHLWGINTLKAQGVEKIVFVTNNGTSTFALADLLSKGSSGETYKLTHDGKTVTFTLGAKDTDVSEILGKA